MKLLKSKKSQMFVFVIVAVVLVVIFALVYLVVSNSKESASQAQLKNKISQSSISSSIENKIQSCLDSVSRNALFIAGEQGGYLFKFQGGLTSKNYSRFGVRVVDFSVPNLEYGASYWIIEPSARTASYGVFVFPYLSHSTIIPGFKAVTIQDNLQSYVLSNFESCFDLNGLKKSFNGSDAHLTGIPSVSVVFNKRNVLFKLHYPLSAYGHQYSDFTSVVNVPFSAMYKSAECFVVNDINNLSFDVQNFNSVCQPPSFISLVPVVKSGQSGVGGYSLLAVNSSIQDSNMNEPVVLYFMRMNRRPVLFDISTSHCALLDNTQIDSNTLTLKTGQKYSLDFSKCVADPDNDPTYITFGLSSDGNNKIYKRGVVDFTCPSSGSFDYYVQAHDSFSGSAIQSLKVVCS